MQAATRLITKSTTTPPPFVSKMKQAEYTLEAYRCTCTVYVGSTRVPYQHARQRACVLPHTAHSDVTALSPTEWSGVGVLCHSRRRPSLRRQQSNPRGWVRIVHQSPLRLLLEDIEIRNAAALINARTLLARVALVVVVFVHVLQQAIAVACNQKLYVRTNLI